MDPEISCGGISPSESPQLMEMVASSFEDCDLPNVSIVKDASSDTDLTVTVSDGAKSSVIVSTSKLPWLVTTKEAFKLRVFSTIGPSVDQSKPFRVC
jgi:type III secretory pathway lipoprotein EscJ